jgi:ribosomal protein L18E
MASTQRPTDVELTGVDAVADGDGMLVVTATVTNEGPQNAAVQVVAHVGAGSYDGTERETVEIAPGESYECRLPFAVTYRKFERRGALEVDVEAV